MWSQALLLVLTCLSWSYAQEDSDAIAKRLPTLKLYEYEEYERGDELYLFYNETYAKIITYQGRRQYPTNAISITDIVGYKNKTYVTYLSSIGYNTYWHKHNLLKGFACYYANYPLQTQASDECFRGMIKALARANNTWIKENIIPFRPGKMFFDLQFIVCIEEILIRGSTIHFDWIHRFYTKDYPTTNFY